MALAFVGAMAERAIPRARVRIECWDVAKTACDMAFVNLALHGVPARVIWGNSLTREVIRAWTNPFWDDPHLVTILGFLPRRGDRQAEREAS